MEGDRDEQRKRRKRRQRGTQEERDRSTQYSVPYVFSIAQNTHRDSQNWIEKRWGREEIEVIWGRKRRFQRGRE